MTKRNDGGSNEQTADAIASGLQDTPTRKQRSIGDSMLDSAVSSGFVTIITFLTGIALARILGPDGRGQYGAIQFWAQFGATFLTFSLYESMVVRLRSRGDVPSSAIPMALSIAIGLFLITSVVMLTAIAFDLFAVDGLPPYLTFIFILSILAIALVNKALIAIETAGLNFRRMNVERVLSPALFLLVAAALFAFNLGSLAVVLLVFLLTKLPIALFRLVKFRKHLIGAIDGTLVKQVISLAPRLHMATGALAIAQQADRLVITTFWSAEALGYYFLAYAVCGAGLSLASQAIQITLLPTLAGVFLKERRRKVEQLIRLSLIVALAVAVPVWLISPWIVPLVYGAEFTPAVGYVQGLMAAMILTPTISIINIANRASERGWPGVEMAVGSLLMFGAGWLITGFERPEALFVTLVFSNLASLAAGARHLIKDGSLRIKYAFLPQPRDVVFLFRAFWRYFIQGLTSFKIFGRRG